VFFLSIFSIQLKAQQLNVDYKNYKIESAQKQNEAINKLLTPYADSVHKTMNDVIGFSVHGVYNKSPENILGNFMADAVLAMAIQFYKNPINIALLNNGGIRSFIAKGDITVGRIYEIMPFDNVIVLQEISGAVLQQLLNRMAEKGGCPLAGITMSIDTNKKAINILINNRPINEFELYTLAIPDYLANGGGGCEMLKDIPQVNKNYLVRDALISYIKTLTAQGKSIDVKSDNRVNYANH
jgi:2',3'-cyclic-nucleotide 2'-phosphodiesterase (5'-nucleotidase family)